MYKDVFISDFTAADFENAFKLYFAELGIDVKDWDGLFEEMNNDPNGKNYAYVRLGEDERVIGFIQITINEMKSWFFSAKTGFVREFWIAPGCRNEGHGGELLSLAEQYFKAQGAAFSILTTDTAENFYIKHGYTKENGITALNKDAVHVKRLYTIY